MSDSCLLQQLIVINEEVSSNGTGGWSESSIPAFVSPFAASVLPRQAVRDARDYVRGVCADIQ